VEGVDVFRGGGGFKLLQTRVVRKLGNGKLVFGRIFGWEIHLLM
jgi:hypothetical protein